MSPALLVAALAALTCIPIAAPARDVPPSPVPHELRERARTLMELRPQGVQELERRAVGGDAEAMALLGEAYGLGFGELPVSEGMAAEWLGRAADSGLPWARHAAEFFKFRATRGDTLERAGTALERARAIALSPESAPAPAVDPDLLALGNLGMAEAQMLLGFMHEVGRGAPRDPQLAEDWYARAAASGDGMASFALSRLYAGGRGMPRDTARSMVFLAEAAGRGAAVAQRRLAEELLRGEMVAADPVEALKWLLVAASAGDRQASGAVPILGASLGPDAAREAARRATGWLASPGR